MQIRIHGSELIRATEHPMPWWSDQARLALGKTALGTPGTELDNDGEPTGWFIFEHESIDIYDAWLMDLIRAGWAYIDSLGADGEGLEEYQATLDWEAWNNLYTEYRAHRLTREECLEKARAYAIAFAASLGIDPPDVDVTEEEAEAELNEAHGIEDPEEEEDEGLLD